MSRLSRTIVWPDAHCHENTSMQQIPRGSRTPHFPHSGPPGAISDRAGPGPARGGGGAIAGGKINNQLLKPKCHYGARCYWPSASDFVDDFFGSPATRSHSFLTRLTISLALAGSENFVLFANDVITWLMLLLLLLSLLLLLLLPLPLLLGLPEGRDECRRVSAVRRHADTLQCRCLVAGLV